MLNDSWIDFLKFWNPQTVVSIDLEIEVGVPGFIGSTQAATATLAAANFAANYLTNLGFDVF